MTDEFAEMLDPQEPPRRRRPRSVMSPEADLQRRIQAASVGQGELNSAEFMRPVTQGFLVQVFGMRPETVKKRLLKCPTLKGAGNARAVYDFKTACSYLLKPKMDIATYLKTLNPADMPSGINKVFWEAERIKNKTLIETGEAWMTADVLDVFGAVFMMFKDRLPLLAEEMREHGLTDAQVEALQALTDQLQRDLHEELVELPKRRQTPSRRYQVEQTMNDLAGDPVEEIE